MNKSIQSFKKDISTLRTGRANTNMLDTLKVDVYGQQMPIEQLATVSVPEARLISIQVWDKGLVSSVEKAIRDSNLGLNPVSEGQLVRVPIPPLSEERRVELTKIAGRYTEEAKVSIRNIRRDANKAAETAAKDKTVGEDTRDDIKDEVQELTKKFETKVNDMSKQRESEVLED